MGLAVLQFGQKLEWSKMMLFLQRSQRTAPIWPQPLQEWGARRSRGLGNVVFFTIFNMISLILLRRCFIIKHNNISVEEIWHVQTVTIC